MGKKRYYAVREGRSTGIFSDWLSAKDQVDGFRGSVYKGFETLAEAEAFMGCRPREATPTRDYMPSHRPYQPEQVSPDSSPAFAPSYAPSAGYSQRNNRHSSQYSNGYQRPHPYQRQPMSRQFSSDNCDRAAYSSSPPSSPAPAASSSSSSSSSSSASALRRSGVLYCDGAAKYNPTGPSGCGGVLYFNDSTGEEQERTFKRYLGNGSNNAAEYSGLIMGMELAHDYNITHLTIKLDSELIAKQMAGEYKVKAANLQPLYQDALALARRFKECSVQHIYREENSYADRLANQAIVERC